MASRKRSKAQRGECARGAVQFELRGPLHIFVKNKPDRYALGDDGVPRKDAY